MKTYQPTIGLEVHVHLKTKSKMFCSSANAFEESSPNVHICPICLGYPGVLPVPNIEAIKLVLKVGLALNCKPTLPAKFDRKHYFYPDLPKNFQISQYDLPFSQKGFLEIEGPPFAKASEGSASGGKKVTIKRVHLEEDAGKLLHPEGNYSLVDFNRAGVPLLEIVTEPDIASPEEAKKLLQEVQLIVRYLGASDAEMEKGQLRCDANVSIQVAGRSYQVTKLGIPVEIKNMNSFRAVEKALTYEIERQTKVLESGGKVTKETRGWDEKKGVTYSQRGKEYAEDYRYFPEPDLPPISSKDIDIEGLKKELPELPQDTRIRLRKDYGLFPKEIGPIISETKLVQYFEEVIRKAKPKLGHLVADFMINEGTRDKLSPQVLGELVSLINEGEISGKIAKEILPELLEKNISPHQLIGEKGLKLIKDEKSLEKIVERVVERNRRAVVDYKKGKTAALTFLVGQVMRETKGQANPKLVPKILEEKLK